jgi:hypothetical protein
MRELWRALGLGSCSHSDFGELLFSLPLSTLALELA